MNRLHRITLGITGAVAALAMGAGMATACPKPPTAPKPTTADRADWAEGIRFCAKVEDQFAYESCLVGHVIETRGRAVPENAWTLLDDDNGTGVPEMRLVRATGDLTPVSTRKPDLEDRALMREANDDCITVDDLTVAWRNCVVGAFALNSYPDASARYVTDDVLNASWSTKTHRFVMRLDHASQRQEGRMHAA